jgi:hypothetical protein
VVSASSLDERGRAAGVSDSTAAVYSLSCAGLTRSGQMQGCLQGPTFNRSLYMTWQTWKIDVPCVCFLQTEADICRGATGISLGSMGSGFEGNRPNRDPSWNNSRALGHYDLYSIVFLPSSTCSRQAQLALDSACRAMLYDRIFSWLPLLTLSFLLFLLLSRLLSPLLFIFLSFFRSCLEEFSPS